jgi:hypothetical protein
VASGEPTLAEFRTLIEQHPNEELKFLSFFGAVAEMKFIVVVEKSESGYGGYVPDAPAIHRTVRTMDFLWRQGMGILAVEIEIPYAVDVHTTADTLTVDLSDGPNISIPLGWYPRLGHASHDERSNRRLIGKGQGIRWEDIDEDISMEVLLAGKRSGESQASFKKWLQTRQSVQKARTRLTECFLMIGGDSRTSTISPNSGIFSATCPKTCLPLRYYVPHERFWIEQGYQQLSEESGLDHHEGRSWPRWHRHMPLVFLAFGYLTLPRRQEKSPSAGLVAPKGENDNGQSFPIDPCCLKSWKRRQCAFRSSRRWQDRERELKHMSSLRHSYEPETCR